jgi:sulfur relay (sulfurtransferase) DsrC/TusE family protein
MVPQYAFKVVYEIVLTPVTYMVVKRVKKREGVDTFSTGVSYNLFTRGANDG